MRRVLPIILTVLALVSVSCGKPVPTPTPTPTATPTPSPVTYTDTVVIAAGAVVDVPLSLQTSNRVNGDITVQGGSGNDVRFAIIDPFGNVVQNPGVVTQQRAFAFIAATGGSFKLRFDNSFSLFLNKVVKYNITVYYR